MSHSRSASTLEGVLLKSGLRYADARLEKTRERIVTITDSEVTEAREGESSGGNIRVWDHGKVGFLSFSGSHVHGGLIDEAISVAVLEPLYGEITPTCSPVVRCRWWDKYTPKYEALKSVAGRLAGVASKSLASSLSISLRYEDCISSKSVVTNAGTRVDMHGGWAALHVTAYADGFKFENAFASKRGFGDWSLVESVCRRLFLLALQTSQAPTVNPGEVDIVLDPELAGIFTHELIGHTAEADCATSGSSGMWDEILGAQVAPPLITVIDHGNNLRYCGCSPFDDEGVPTKPTIILNRGIVSSSLHTKLTSAKRGIRSTGNGRSLHYRFPPIARMTCTYMTPGNMSVSALIGGIKYGYLLRGQAGGQNDLSQSIIRSRESFEIRDGRVRRRVKPISILAQFPKSLWSVDGLSATWRLFEAAGAAGCGKWDQAPLPVTFGGPYMRVRNIMAFSHEQ